jgi:hypothetical protein
MVAFDFTRISPYMSCKIFMFIINSGIYYSYYHLMSCSPIIPYTIPCEQNIHIDFGCGILFHCITLRIVSIVSGIEDIPLGIGISILGYLYALYCTFGSNNSFS